MQVGVLLGIIRKVDHPWPPLDVVEGEETPVAAVIALVAVVAHHEEVAGRDLHGAEVVADQVVVAVVFAFLEYAVVLVQLERLCHRIAVDVDLFILDLQLVPWDPHHALDQVFAWLLQRLEDYDVIVCDGLAGQDLVLER